jgi:hypothetical protein
MPRKSDRFNESKIISNKIIVLQTIENKTYKQAAVLLYLKNIERDTPPQYFSNIRFYASSLKSLIQLIENPESMGHLPFTYVAELHIAIDKMYRNFVKSFPILKANSQTDATLAKLLSIKNESILGKPIFFKTPVTKNAVIDYLQRNSNIYDWNTDFLYQVMFQCDCAKKQLLGSYAELDYPFEVDEYMVERFLNGKFW